MLKIAFTQYDNFFKYENEELKRLLEPLYNYHILSYDKDYTQDLEKYNTLEKDKEIFALLDNVYQLIKEKNDLFYTNSEESLDNHFEICKKKIHNKELIEHKYFRETFDEFRNLKHYFSKEHQNWLKDNPLEKYPFLYTLGMFTTKEIERYNTLEMNKEILKLLKQEFQEVEKLFGDEFFYRPDSYKDVFNKLIETCNKNLKNGKLCIDTLVELSCVIGDCRYDHNEIYHEKEKKRVQEDINKPKKSFIFNYSENEIIDIVKKEVNWRKKERDIEIYKQRQRALLLDEIASQYRNLNASAISKITIKVKGAINYYKGKLFEKEYYKYLVNLKKYDKVILGGESGKPDIIAFDLKNNILHVFSLKNLKIDYFNYRIKKELLKQEIIYSMEKFFEFTEVMLHVVVLNNWNNHIQHFNYDYRHPESLKVNP